MTTGDVPYGYPSDSHHCAARRVEIGSAYFDFMVQRCSQDSQNTPTRSRQRNNTPLSPLSPRYARTSRSLSLASTPHGSSATPTVVQLPVQPASFAPSPLLPPTDERATVLEQRNDGSAVQIILALLHEYFVAIDRLHRGRVPDDVFAIRFRLLKEDIMTLGYEAALQERGLQYRYPAIISLPVLREKTLLAGRTEQIIHWQTWVRGHYTLCA
ncbi:hypothetical protein BDZ89DRAFT_559667 [Hymenopellis radicata]|nr:hypothetical protein BDZ89DRAFT_559667 [Hymenopellis radicata]